jgi:DNA-directed RNA polymerase subunit F
LSPDDNQTKPVSLSEVKNILTKISKDREELIYEQKIALEHAQKFAKLPVKKTEEIIKELSKLDFLQQNHVYKIADILPKTPDDIKTIFAKERLSLGENEIKKILEIVSKYSIDKK